MVYERLGLLVGLKKQFEDVALDSEKLHFFFLTFCRKNISNIPGLLQCAQFIGSVETQEAY